MMTAERVLFVHAHPDDESITTGGTIATLVEGGATVGVLTCTRGELGEIIPADLASLTPDELGRHREGELADALAVLGVSTHFFLGSDGARFDGLAPRQYRDSGMRWGEAGPEPLAELDPRSFCAADLSEVNADVAAVVTTFEPDVIVSYDRFGGYGHPDHIRAHQAALHVARAMAIPFYAIEPATGASVHEPGLLTIDVGAMFERKRAAMSAHRSQLVVDGDRFELSDGVGQPITRQEVYRGPGESSSATRAGGQGLATRVVLSILAVVLGATVGLLATVNHQAATEVAAIPIWYGLGLAILTVAMLLIGTRLVTESRWVPGLVAVGMVAAVGVLSMPSTGGSVLVPANPIGYIWALTPTVIAVIVIGWPRLHVRPRH